jgi:nitroreductase
MPELHPLLAGRWSPHGFDPLSEVSATELASLLEAARWAPSVDNSQPWRFAIGRRDDETYKRIFTSLPEEHQRWAWRASVLVAGGHVTVSDTDGPLPHGPYDLGQAVAHLSLQAAALGLHVHQIAGFDMVTLHRELDLPDSVAVHVVIAVGRLGDPATLPADLRQRDLGLRHRHPLTDLLLVSSR